MLLAKSVTQPVCSINVYFIPLLKRDLGFIVRVLPLIVLVNNISFPVLVLSSMAMFPAFMDSLKVILIIWFVGIFIAFLTGIMVFTVGGMLSTVKLLPTIASGLPVKSVILPVCKVSVYFPLVNSAL